MSEPYQIESFGQTDVGLVRTNNEDVFRLLQREKFFILADGMGGHNAGEVAASRAVEYMCTAVQNFFVKPLSTLSLEQLSSHIAALIENTNLWVHHLSSSDPKLQGMGTTLCSILFHQKSVIYSHVGDSRIYRLRGDLLTPLTIDHLSSQSKNPLSETQKAVSSSKKVLAQAIGTSIMVRPDVGRQAVEKEDLYLMCSDGLTDCVSDSDIKKILLSSQNLAALSGALIEKAKESGGHDNITLLLMRVQ